MYGSSSTLWVACGAAESAVAGESVTGMKDVNAAPCDVLAHVANRIIISVRAKNTLAHPCGGVGGAAPGGGARARRPGGAHGHGHASNLTPIGTPRARDVERRRAPVTPIPLTGCNCTRGVPSHGNYTGHRPTPRAVTNLRSNRYSELSDATEDQWKSTSVVTPHACGVGS